MRGLRLAVIVLVACFLVPPVQARESKAEKTIYIVNSLVDPHENAILPSDGILTLREALLLCNSDQSPSLITFDAGLSRGIIRLQRELPHLVESDTEIDGNTQTDSSLPADCIRILAAAADPPGLNTQNFCLRLRSGGHMIRNLAIGGSAADGIQLVGNAAVNNTVTACYLGRDPFGELTNDEMVLSNGLTVQYGASGNLILGCVISNCRTAGILVSQRECQNNTISRNIIGTNLAGVPGNGTGVYLKGSRNLVGGNTSLGVNSISGNSLNGVLVEGADAAFNRISHNSFRDNGRLAIDLSSLGGLGDGPTPYGRTGPGARRGPNQWVAAPNLREYNYELRPGDIHQFTLRGTTQRPMTVEVYAAAPDPLGFGEGVQFLGAFPTDGNYAFSCPIQVDPGTAVTLLGIDVDGNTSEFSQTFTLNDSRGVIQLTPWQNFSHVPAGVTRKIGFSANRRSNGDIPLALTATNPLAIQAPTSAEVPAGQAWTTIDVTGREAGGTYLQVQLPASAGGAICAPGVYVDEAVPVTLDPVTVRHDALTGLTPVRLYRFTGQEGDLLDVTVTPEDGSPIDPLVILFNTSARNLAVNDNYRGLASFIQLPLPADGEYFLAVQDLYFRSGSEYSYTLNIWPEPFDPAEWDQPQLVERDPLPSSGVPGRLAFGDLDGDGFKDIVATLPGGNALQVFFRNGGTGGNFAETITESLSFTPGALALGDFDLNQRLDILVSGRDTDEVAIFFNTGQWSKAGAPGPGLSGWPCRVFRTGAGGTEGASTDLNNDSFPDLVLLDANQKLLTAYLNDGLGNLAQAWSQATGIEPVAIQVADFNADTIPDVALADAVQGAVTLLQGSGDGTFLLNTTLAVPGQPSDLKTADLDQDGLPDLIVTGRADNVIVTYRSVQAFDFVEYQQFSTGTGPNSIALADLNADGFEDVSVSNSGSQDIYVYMGIGAGLLQPVGRLSADGQIEQLFWYSFGGYGSYFGVPPDQSFVRVLEGNYRVMNFPDTDVNELYSTAFALANPSAEDALVFLALFNLDGSLVSDASVENPVAVTIPLQQQIAFFVTDIFGDGVSLYQTWMRVSSLNQAVQGFSLLLSNQGSPYYDGATAQLEASPSLLFPVISELTGTSDDYVNLINPGDSATTATVTCRDAAGQTVGTPAEFDLPPNARAFFSLTERFGEAAAPCYLAVTASQPIGGFQFALSDGTMAATNAIPLKDLPAWETALYGAHFAEGRLYRTVLDLINHSGSAAQVTITALRDDGSTLAASAPFTMPAGGLLHGDLSALLGLDYQSADFITGYLRVQSDQPGLHGALTFGDRAGAVFSASLLLAPEGLGDMVFSHLAVGDVGGMDYFTGIAFLNAGAADATFHLSVHDSLGNLTGESDVFLPAGSKISQMLTGFVPGLAPQSQGYILVEPVDPGTELFAFELFGDSQLRFLAAVPAQAR